MKSTFILTAALMISGSMAFAGVTAEQIAADLQAQGFTRIEIKQGPNQIKAEAIRGTERVETVYDAASGDVLKSNTRSVGADDSTRSGVSVRSRDRDFVRTSAGGQSDDGTRAEGHRSRDRDRGQGNGSDDSASGSDDSGNHDSGNHESGNHDSGNHDSGNDSGNHDGGNGGGDNGGHDGGDNGGGDHDSGGEHDSNHD